jgi:hypothetical protein
LLFQICLNKKKPGFHARKKKDRFAHGDAFGVFTSSHCGAEKRQKEVLQKIQKGQAVWFLPGQISLYFIFKFPFCPIARVGILPNEVRVVFFYLF